MFGQSKRKFAYIFFVIIQNIFFIATFGVSSSTGFSFGSPAFGAPAATSQPSTGLFGQPAATTQNSMFGGSVFGASAPAVPGTTVKFNPPLSTDTMQKNGQKTQVNTKHVCITAMKEYQDKSQEVRLCRFCVTISLGASC